MPWYLWVLVFLVGYWLLRKLFAKREEVQQQSSRDSDFAFFGQIRQRQERAWEAVDMVAAAVLNLTPVAEDPLYGTRIKGADLRKSLSNFMLSAAETGISRSTKMLHTVTSPVRIVIFRKLDPLNERPEAAARGIIRVGEDEWAVRTWQVPDWEPAIRAAEAEARKAGGLEIRGSA